MNARSHTFELTVEERQIEEVVAAIFHALLFHRTQGKYHYKKEGSYSIGSVGYVDVDCDFVEYTYVRTASDELDAKVKAEIAAFREELRKDPTPAAASPGPGSKSGAISLEFYQKKRGRWLFPAEGTSWEIWTVKLNIVVHPNESVRQLAMERLAEEMFEKIIYINEAMSRHEFVPKLPTEADLDLVFEVNYPDVQPYCFKIGYQTTMTTSTSVSTTMRKLLKDTLAL